jgi:hypothetical protein
MKRKMRKNKDVLTVVVLFFIFLNSVESQNNKIETKNKRDNQIEVLKEYYDEAHGKDSIKYTKLFFVSFPANFASFNSIYGYDDKKGPMPLYNLYEKHIAFFCTLNCTQSKTAYFNKLIRLGINGHWDADGVNALQDCILSHINLKPKLTSTLLKQFKDLEIRSFWRFIFDGLHPDDKDVKKQYDALYKNVGLIDKKMANLMKEEYLKLVQISNKE